MRRSIAWSFNEAAFFRTRNVQREIEIKTALLALQ